MSALVHVTSPAFRPRIVPHVPASKYRAKSALSAEPHPNNMLIPILLMNRLHAAPPMTTAQSQPAEKVERKKDDFDSISWCAIGVIAILALAFTAWLISFTK